MSGIAASELVRALIRARALEAELVGLRPEGLPPRLRGPLPVSPGVQAALVAGRRADPRDVLCLRRASPAAALALGVPAAALAHEAAGSSRATAEGRSPGGVPTAGDHGLLAAVDPPGTMIEVMAGVALAFRLRKEPRVALLVDDADDAASGYWHEGLNFAGVQKAPLVLIVDGSRRGPLTAAVPRLSTRAPAYGIRAVTVEGIDPRLVLDAVVDATERARGGGGTQLVEVVPGSDDDPVDRLARMEPGVAEGLPELRRVADDEARAAAAEARAAVEGGADGRSLRARQSPWGAGAPLPPPWHPPSSHLESPS